MGRGCPHPQAFGFSRAIATLLSASAQCYGANPSGAADGKYHPNEISFGKLLDIALYALCIPHVMNFVEHSFHALR